MTHTSAAGTNVALYLSHSLTPLTSRTRYRRQSAAVTRREAQCVAEALVTNVVWLQTVIMTNPACRLCGNERHLMYMFDERRREALEILRAIVFIASSVEIKETDLVSKVVCQRCCEIAMKLQKYRQNAVAHDKRLKEQYGQVHVEPSINQHEVIRIAARIHVDLENLNSNISLNVEVPVRNVITKITNASQEQEITTDVTYAHPSIQESRNQYKITFPKENCNSNVSTVVTLQQNAVPNTFEEQYTQDNDIQVTTNILDDSEQINMINSDDDINEYPHENHRNLEHIKMYQPQGVSNTSNLSMLPPLNNNSPTDTFSEHHKHLLGSRKRKLSTDTNVVSDKLVKNTHLPDAIPNTKSTDNSLDTINEPNHLMTPSNKKREVFMCCNCNKLCFSKRSLLQHLKTHLQCKFCRNKFKDVQSLNDHQKESCYINIINNQPSVKLIKIDSIPDIVKRYLRPSEQNTPCKQELPVNSDKCSLGSLSSLASTYVAIKDADVKPYCEGVVKKMDMSNESDDEIQLVQESSGCKMIKNQPRERYPTPTCLGEKEILCSLFKKHNYFPEKSEKYVQTTPFTKSNVKLSESNVIVLENMYPELRKYDIPICLYHQPIVNISYSALEHSHTLSTLTPRLQENWMDTPCIQIRK